VLLLVDHVRHYGWATCHLATYVYREVKAGEVCRVEILEDFDTTADVKFEDDTVAVGLTLRPGLVELERVR
jgi:hypothetical protein